MRRDLHLRLFAPLALAAIVLLALVPTMGRLGGGSAVASAAAPSAVGALFAAPDTLHVAHASGTDPATSPHPPSGEHQGHDCAYCPLLTATVALDAPGNRFAPLHANVPVAPPAAHHLRTGALVPGLGSRGPPRFVQG